MEIRERVINPIGKITIEVFGNNILLYIIGAIPALC